MIKKLLFPLIIALTIFISACETGLNDFNGNDYTGKGGSLARFTIVGNYLYIVDIKNLKTFNISNPSKPELTKTLVAGSQIETIFARNNLLFMGSREGMYIYDITDGAAPKYISTYAHIFSCDPVVADDKYAYVTLSTGLGCRRATNELQVIDIRQPQSPALIAQYSMSNPKGLGKIGNTLFVCDNGLKIYNATTPTNLYMVKHFSIDANDVIPLDSLLLVVGEKTLYEYSFKNNEIVLLSSISIADSTKTLK